MSKPNHDYLGRRDADCGCCCVIDIAGLERLIDDLETARAERDAHRLAAQILAKEVDARKDERDRALAEAAKHVGTVEFLLDQKDGLFARIRSAESAVAAIADLTPDDCWITDSSIQCINWIGATFSNGIPFTEEACCLPCRLRAALAAATITDGSAS